MTLLKRKTITQADLDQAVRDAKRADDAKCHSYHPNKFYQCQKPKGHSGQHFFQYIPGSKVWTWGEE